MKKKAHDQHGLVEAGTLTGAVAGAAAGLLAGPPGVVAGAAVGTAVGYLAGAAMEDAEAKAEAHEEALDEEIGVTGSDLGAREAAARGLDAMKKEEDKRRGHAAAREKALERSLQKT